MKKPSELFNAEDRRKVAAAVSEAERATTGEIVPVVAASSGRYERGADLFGLCLGLAALIAVWLRFQGVRPATDWAAGPVPALGLVPVLVVLVAGFVIGAAMATRWPALKLPFVHRREMEEEVQEAAAAAFRRLRVGRTKEGTGIMIYVSLFERQVRVEGGGAIADRLSASEWKDVCRLAVEGLRDDDPTGGLTRAIAAAGKHLAAHFPARAEHKNELGNDLHLLDQIP